MSAVLRSSGADPSQARRRSPLALIADSNLLRASSATLNFQVRSQTSDRLSAERKLSEDGLTTESAESSGTLTSGGFLSGSV
jgi:hypothetical protein